MTDTQIKGNEPSVQPPVSQNYADEGTTSLGTFRPAMTGALSKAMNELIEALQYITIISRDLQAKETNVGNKTAQKIKDNDYSIGEQQQNEAYTAGGMGLGSALVSGVGIYAGSGLFKAEINEANTNVKGAQNYEKMLGDESIPEPEVVVGENKERTLILNKGTDAERPVTMNEDMTKQVKARVDALKNKTDFGGKSKKAEDPKTVKETFKDGENSEIRLSDEEVIQILKADGGSGELADLKSSISKKVENLQKQVQQLEERGNRLQQRRETIGGTIGKGLESSGTMATASMKKEQRELEGQNAAGQAALQNIHSAASSLNSTVETKQQELSKVIDQKSSVDTSGVRG